MPRLVCVDDGTPEATTRLLRQACERRDVAYVEVVPAQFDFRPERQLVPGDMLYRPATSIAAQRVEQFLYAPGVATFYRDPDGIYYACTNQPLRFQRAGVPVPRSVWATTRSRAALDGHVEFLGGLPVIVKLQGYSGGIGVFKADSTHALYALIDYALTQGAVPMILAYVGDATHWRVVVVGDEAVAAYRNPVGRGDFRTYGGIEEGDFQAVVRADLAAVAVQAVRAMRLELGGIDILEHASGRLYVLESNFPCYHAHAEEHGRIDVSGRMVAHLLAKAARLKAELSEREAAA